MPDKDFMPGESTSVVEAIFAHRWAILPAYLETIIQVATRQGSIEAALAGRAAYEQHSPSAGNPFAADKEIAVIPVIGPIFPRANLMTMVSGATSIQKLTAQFKAAMEDPNIGGIILSVDSPGGEVTGVSEFAQMLFEARGKKPITAYVPGMAASAAYWIASAADEIILADTGEVGSIGVVAAYTDDKEAQRKKGVFTHEIVSSQSPNKRPDISTKEGRALIQSVVDDLAGIFVSTVARNRGVTEDHVMENFGQGGLFVGARSVDRRMADKVGTFESVVQGFQAKMKAKEDQIYYGGSNMNASNPATTQPAAAKPKGKEEEDKEKEDAKGKPFPAKDEDEDDEDAKGKGKGKKASATEAAEAAVNAERARIQGIESLKVPGYENFIAARKWEAGMTKEKLSALILEDQEAKRTAKGAAVVEDATALAKNAAAIGNSGDLPQGTEQDAVYAAMLAGANSRR
jgi:signal peptide peptidase SppA